MRERIYKKNRILLIGLGPHAREYHFLIIKSIGKQEDVEISCIIDLVNQKDTLVKYLRSNDYDINKLYLLEDSERNKEYLSRETIQLLDELVVKYSINAIMIATEPKAHKAYAIWAKKVGLKILIDKPISAPIMDIYEAQTAEKIFKDYIEIKDAGNRNDIVAILASRRTHPVIEYVYDYLKNFIELYQVPITHISIYHTEGMWNMPNEYLIRENHPYKYGYGLMLHSGYHFIDLYLHFLKLNNYIEKMNSSKIDFVCSFTTPEDINSVINRKIYNRLLKKDFPEIDSCADIYRNMGEVDAQILCRSSGKEGFITSGVINLLQTSYSTRYRTELPVNTYKENGRTYQEIISIELGHILCIYIYKMSAGKVLHENIGSDEFVVKIFRNSNLLGGDTLINKKFNKEVVFEIGEKEHVGTIGMAARTKLIYDWLYGGNQISNLESHVNSIRFLAEIYKSIFNARKNGKYFEEGNFLLKNNEEMEFENEK